MLLVFKSVPAPGLFDKLVPIKGSTTRAGNVISPHFGTRKVRMPEPVPPKPVAKPEHVAEQPKAAAEKPAAKPRKKAKDEATGDLFATPAPAEKPKEAPKEERKKRTKAADEFKVGDVIDQQGKTNSRGLVTITAIEGNSIKFRDEAGTDYYGMPRATVRNLINGGSWKRASTDDLGKWQPTPKSESAAESAENTTTNLRTVDFNEPFDPSAVPDFGVPAGITKGERRAINDSCKQAIGSAATRANMSPEALRNLLKKYSGNGGCGDSLNEFYTDPKVSAAAWYVLRNSGLPEGAEVLEPSCATGVFFETKPAGVHGVGVELDGTSSKIATILHPDDEIHDGSLESFATTDTRQFDAVVGNAPFGLRGGLIKDDKPDLKTAEAYFLDTGIDKTKPGGMVAMIVPTGVMDSRTNRWVRERLLRKAQFVGAVRMPNTAFEHSHTEVTTDLVFFRKRSEDVAQALGVVDQATLQRLGLWDDEFLAGTYFTGRGAPNIFGTMTEGWRAKAGMGEDITVEGSMTGVPEAIAAFVPDEPAHQNMSVEDILVAVGGNEEMQGKVRTAALRRPYDTAKRGDTKVVDGVTYILDGHPLRWHRMDEVLQSQGITDAQELAPLIDAAMHGNAPADLAERVKAYVEKFGVPSKNPNLVLAAKADKQLYRLIGAVKPDGSLSDAVTGASRQLETTFDAAAETLAADFGEFTAKQLVGRWDGGNEESALDHLYASPNFAFNPDGTWTTMDAYLSGELWPKYDLITSALAGADLKPEDRAKLDRQREALEEAIGQKPLEDVEVALNSGFVPLKVVAAFFNEQRDEQIAAGHSWAANQPPMEVTYEKGIYTITGGGYSDPKLLGKYLNRTGVRKEEDMPTIDRWNREFKDWLCASKYRDEVESLYNRNFRGFVKQKAYSEKPFDIPGMSGEASLNGYQYAGLRWALEAKKGIIAADVGLGKTPRGLILARLAKVSGMAKKAVTVVPKSVMANWLAEAQRWFPGCSVLTIGESFSRNEKGDLVGKADNADERNRKLHDLTQNDYDFVFISKPAWNDIDLDPAKKLEYAEQDFWVQRADGLDKAGDKRINAVRTRYEQSVAGRDFQKRTDAIYFNDIGIDFVVADEAHSFKNLFAAKNRFGQSPKFLGGQGLSNTAYDMDLKTKWIRDNNGGNNVYFLTATPTKNSPLEVYSMLHHIAPEAFEKIGIKNSEEFIDRFCEFKEENILGINGEVKRDLVTVGFKNLDELREIMRRYIDRKTAEDVGLVLPKRDDRMHMVDVTPQQKSVYEVLREQAEEAAGKRDAKGEDHIFSIMRRMQDAAMDLEIYDSGYAGATSPKYDECAKQILEGIKEGGQVVFSDTNAVHEKIAAALVKAGVPRDQIAIINADVAPSAAKRQNISDAFNAGKLKVVIGNTATMGEGANLQKGTTDIHHMDMPWEPASVQQRNGRGLRQGNLKEAVRIHTYLAKGSFDGYRYQCVSAKKDWQDLLWNGGDRVENLAREGNISRDEMMIMLSADPETARAKFEGDKAEAQKRFEADQRLSAVNSFDRLQTMKQSFAGLKNKETKSANMLRVKIERAQTELEANQYFTAKAALKSDKPVVIHPETHDVLQPNTGIELPGIEKEGEMQGGGKWVITGVNVRTKEVKARRYATLERPVPFEMKDLSGLKIFHYSEDEEKRDYGEFFSKQKEEKVAEMTKPADLRGMPTEVVESNYADLQKKLKDGFKNYEWSPQYGRNVTLIKDGVPISVASYTARGMLEDHDIALPTEKNREAMLNAYLADERNKDFRMDYPAPPSGRRGRSRHSGSSEQKLKTSYPGEYGASSNRWADSGDELFGKEFKREARAKFETAQNAEARKAKSLTEAISAVVPMVQVDYHGFANWPKQGLAILWAHAKKEGKLDAPLSTVIPQRGGNGWASSQPKYPAQMFAGRFSETEHSTYGSSSYVNTRIRKADDMTVREALSMLSHASDHHDLSAVMLTSAKDPRAALRELLTMPRTPKVLAAIRHVSEHNHDLANTRAADVFGGVKDRSITVADYASGPDEEEDNGPDRIAA